MIKSNSCEKWRLKLNWFIVLFLVGILFKVSSIAYLTSFHRFVTNPRSTNQLNGTKSNIDVGLGESEFFYSFILSTLYISACIGTLVSGCLVACVPYWYLFVTAVCTQILGYAVYGLATQGWHVLLSQILVGYFVGAFSTLSLSYANDSSTTYAKVITRETHEVDEEYRVRIRDFLYTLINTAAMFGYYVGFAVLFSYLKIDHFRSIGWFNAGFGTLLLFLVIFLFRGERSRKKSRSSTCHPCRGSCSKPSRLQIFIILSLFLLSFIDILKMGFYDTLLSPVLSDAFGLSLTVISYFFLALGVPRVLGTILVLFLQKVKLSSSSILLVGITVTMTAYVFLTDWQSIPYDPCTEYSPFHHPEIIRNLTSKLNNKSRLDLTPLTLPEIQLQSVVEFQFDDNTTQHTPPPAFKDVTCKLDTSYFKAPTLPCLEVNTLDKAKNDSSALHYTCSSAQIYDLLCLIIKKITEQDPATAQELQIFSDTAPYTIARNSCMNAGRHCHWVPISTITNSLCNDCPPICRAEEQTLNFVQFVIGIALLFLVFPAIDIPLMSVLSNHAPRINGTQIVITITSHILQSYSCNTNTGSSVQLILYNNQPCPGSWPTNC